MALPTQQLRWQIPASIQSRIKIPLLYGGDIFLFYGALCLTLFLRYGGIDVRSELFAMHIGPFTLALCIWLFIFYAGGLYDKQIFNYRTLSRRFFPLIGIGALVLMGLFYFVPTLGIAPKANLFIFLLIYAVTGYSWRMLFIAALRWRSGITANRVLLVGENAAADEIVAYTTEHPQFGYQIGLWLKHGLRGGSTPEDFLQFVTSHGIHTVVVPKNIEHDHGALRMLYYAFLSGIEVMSTADFYEMLFDRVALVELEDSWLIRNLPRVAKGYHLLKYLCELAAALGLLVATLPITVCAALAIAISSPGPIFYRQIRVGQHEQPFLLCKFRSMYASKEKNPDADAATPTWSQQNDPRITPVGKFLRATHIDELPQLINIICGQMSFVGPRPERPEFTAQLSTKIPYYELRFLLKPGITGWAQINYRYGASVDDAYQKLQYEIYYLKHRSLWLDLAIIAKTIKRIFIASAA